MKTTGHVRFSNDRDCEDVIHEIGWTDTWPPPVHLFLAAGIVTGRFGVGDAFAIAKMKRDSPDWREHVTIQMFERVRASTLPDEVIEGGEGFVLRVAVYTPIFSTQDDVELLA